MEMPLEEIGNKMSEPITCTESNTSIKTPTNTPIDINVGRTAVFIDDHLTSVPKLDKGIPPFSCVEFSLNALCTRRCIFCPRKDAEAFPNLNKHLSFDLFKKVIKELETIDFSGRLSFSGFGEPLLTKDIFEYIKYAKEKCPKCIFEIVSNGDVLTKEVLKKLFDSGLDVVRLSLYTGPEQIDYFNKMTQELGLNDKQVILRKRYLSPEENYGLTISNRAGSITLKNDGIDVEPLKEPMKQPCHYPFYNMMVDYDGKVIMCSSDWFKKLVVGDLNSQTIFEVWNSNAFNTARKSLITNNRNFEPCKTCDVNGILNGKPHFLAWKEYYKNNSKV